MDRPIRDRELRRTAYKIFLRIALCTSVLVAASSYSQPQKPFTEADIRVAIIHRILLFTDWGAIPRADQNICTLGQDDSIKELRALETIQLQNNTPVSIEEYHSGDQQCLAMIIGSDIDFKQTQLPEPSLVICNDCKESQLIAVNLLRINNQIRYDLDIRAASAIGVRFRSDVLKWANKVNTQ
jgi:hypothetical protein